VWLQGWNDMVDRGVYPELPKGSTGNRFAKYSEWMAQFIRDVRKDFGAPKMPFVIGVMGVDGAKGWQRHHRFPRSHDRARAAAGISGQRQPPFPPHRFGQKNWGPSRRNARRSRRWPITSAPSTRTHANKDGTMTDAQQREYVKKYELRSSRPRGRSVETRARRMPAIITSAAPKLSR
jgi:hypothetical protein